MFLDLRNVDISLLVSKLKSRMDSKVGTTTVEKSGYGLDIESELKSLFKAINEVNNLYPISMIPTFMGLP